MSFTVMSYSVIHYGIPYLNYALRNIAPLVDQSYVFFTPHPSHGHGSGLPPIESRDEIMASIPAGEWDKLTWVDVDQFWQEGAQRDYAVRYLENEGAGLILVLDYDEFWLSETLKVTLDFVWKENRARHWLINFSHHLWRSFNWACSDDGRPVRIIDTRWPGGTAYVPKEFGDIFHLGYAITTETLKYKLSIHGHKDELRPGWLEEKWLAWPPPDDCHPTNGKKENGEGWWNPKPFDRRKLPEVLRAHPWYDLEKIE